MKGKLIKLSDTHYVVVDDSEIKEGDWFLPISGQGWKLYEPKLANKQQTFNIDYCKKITHSTQQLENPITSDIGIDYKLIALSEVEEAIYGYSVEKMAEDDTIKRFGLKNEELSISFCNGFKTHQELTKDKLFTVDDMKKAIKEALYYWNKNANTESQAINNILQSFLPKTEWDIEFDEQDKIKLL